MGTAWSERKNQFWAVCEESGSILPHTLKRTRKEAIAARMKTIDDAVALGDALNMPIRRRTWSELKERGTRVVKVRVVEKLSNNTNVCPK